MNRALETRIIFPSLSSWLMVIISMLARSIIEDSRYGDLDVRANGLTSGSESYRMGQSGGA
jgi:hypothetical protein